MLWLNEILILIKSNEKPLHTESNHSKALAERCKTTASIDKSFFVCLCEKCNNLYIRAPSARKYGFTYKSHSNNGDL